MQISAGIISTGGGAKPCRRVCHPCASLKRGASESVSFGEDAIELSGEAVGVGGARARLDQRGGACRWPSRGAGAGAGARAFGDEPQPGPRGNLRFAFPSQPPRPSLPLTHPRPSNMSSAPRVLNSALRLSSQRTASPLVSFAVQRRGHATAVTPPSPSTSSSGGSNSAAKPAWTREQVQEVYDTPLMELIFRSVSVG